MSSILRKLSNRLNPQQIRARAKGSKREEIRGDTVQVPVAQVVDNEAKENVSETQLVALPETTVQEIPSLDVETSKS